MYDQVDTSGFSDILPKQLQHIALRAIYELSPYDIATVISCAERIRTAKYCRDFRNKISAITELTFHNIERISTCEATAEAMSSVDRYFPGDDNYVADKMLLDFAKRHGIDKT